MKMKLASILVFLLFIQLKIPNQNRKVVNDPQFLNQLQGVWADITPGERWIKIVIRGNKFYYFMADPSDGRWSDWTSQHQPNTITSSVKISERNNYNGKWTSTSVAYTDNDNNGIYHRFLINVENGKKYLTVVAQGDNERLSDRTGENLNRPIVTDNLRKRADNFNPWAR